MSKMSGSPTKPPGSPRWSSVYPAGGFAAGSTGRSASVGTIGCEWSGSPSASTGYQTGIGTPKNRWRETSQSPLRPLTQFA